MGIGSPAIILHGVNIGAGAIVGTGAVVMKDVADHAIVGGNPTKASRHRMGQTFDSQA